MERPNLKNCTKKVTDYITSLERKIESLNKEIEDYQFKQTVSKVSQDVNYLSKRKIYLPEFPPIDFLVDNKKISVSLKDKDNQLYISGYMAITIEPSASNCVYIGHKKR